jgi:hypothetical protein
MKKVYILPSLLFIFISFVGFSKQVDADFASTIATKFIHKNQSSSKRNAVSLKLHYTSVQDVSLEQNKRAGAKNSYYIFNFTDNKGFVIIAADDKVNPILGYSLEQSFDIAKAPSNVLGWLKRYDEEITRIVAIESMPVHTEWERIKSGVSAPKRATQVAPLLQTKWDQSPLYNDSCPKDPSTNSLSVTGCVATAMAQTMKYWNYPAKGAGSNQYTLNTFGTLKADFSKSVYRWGDMTNTLTATSTMNSKTAVAQLMRDCGYAVNMQYSSKGSGAWVFGRTSPTAEYALIQNFGYSSSMTSLNKDDFTEVDWISKLKTEFDQSRVVVYVGYTSDLASGHCFMADGYDANNFIHFNWGWGGYADGYFAITNLAPVSNYNFSTLQGAIMGIKPPTCVDGIVGNDVVCLGTSNFYKTSYPGGTWSSSNTTIASISTSGVLTSFKEGVVTLTYTLPLGSSCSSTSYVKEVRVVGYPQRPAMIYGDSTLCQLESKKYSVDATVTGNWSTTSLNINVFNDGSVVGVTAGKAMLTFNYGNVCNHDTINKWINVKATPVVPLIKGIDSLCVNATVQYSNTLTGGTWSVMDNLSSVSTSGLLKGLSQGYTRLVYTKKGTNGCVGKSTKSIKVKAIPMPLIQGPDSLCLKSTGVYSASIFKGTWSVINSMISSTTAGLVTAKTAGTSGLKYTVIVNGCSNSVTKQVIVKALPVVGTLSGSTSFCGTLTTTLIPSVKGGVWSISNTPIFSINQSGVVASNNTVNSSAMVTYTIRANNCLNSITKSISVSALPNIAISGLDSLNVNQQSTYKASVTGGVWSALDARIKVTSTGVVTGVSASAGSGLKYQVNGSGACTGKASFAVKSIKVLAPSFLVMTKSTADVFIYPNPTSGLINVSTDRVIARVVLMDMTGRVIEDNSLTEGVASLDYTHVVPGKYMLFVTKEDSQVTNMPIIIER